jgi:hypothetical protein
VWGVSGYVLVVRVFWLWVRGYGAGVVCWGFWFWGEVQGLEDEGLGVWGLGLGAMGLVVGVRCSE